MKKLSIIFCICTLLLCSLLAGCGSKEPAPAADHKLRVVVTFNAMKEFTQAVGQDKIHITSLIPDGTEPHDFQPTTKTMQALSKADILIYNSTGMERWVEQATQAAANPKLVIVEAAKGTDRISLTEADEIRAHGQYDPHTWLSLSCAQTEVKNIAEALQIRLMLISTAITPQNTTKSSKRCLLPTRKNLPNWSKKTLSPVMLPLLTCAVTSACSNKASRMFLPAANQARKTWPS